MDHIDDCTCTSCLQRRCIKAQRVEIARLRSMLQRVGNAPTLDTMREIVREALGGGCADPS